MSKAVYKTGALRFWNEQELLQREMVTRTLLDAIKTTLQTINTAWTFHQIEAPVLIEAPYLSTEYDGEDVFVTQHKINDNYLCLRPETTPSTYAYQRVMSIKTPVCVWQVGKSFRRELNDGASASKLRYIEFNQLEFQCFYSATSFAGYGEAIRDTVWEFFANLFRDAQKVRLVELDRLPSYSIQTFDIEVKDIDRWHEICSLSDRTDYDDKTAVLEIAVGIDRVVELL